MNLPEKLQRWFVKPDKDGYVPGLSFDSYAKMAGVNASLLKQRTAAQMRFELERTEEKLSYAFALGEAVHKAILEPDLFEGNGIEEYFQYSPTKGLDTKAAREALAADPTRPLVTPEIIEKAKRLRNAVFSHQWAAKLLKGCSKRELSGFAWDNENQVLRKIRVDFLPAKPANYMLDLKMVRSISEWEMRKTVSKLGYHIQAAWYMDTHRMITGEARELFFIIAYTGPTGANDDVGGGVYEADVFELNSPLEFNFVQEGREKYQTRLAMLLQACHQNCWESREHAEPTILTSKW